MDKTILVLILVISLFSLVGCTSIPDSTPTLMTAPSFTPTFTPQLSPSVTATVTLTPTNTSTATHTATPSPTATLPPTETPFPRFLFERDYDDGLAGFDYINQKGAKVELIEDPTGSGRGKVLKGSIAGVPQEEDIYFQFRRGSPGKGFPFQAFPCRVQEDIWMSKQFFDDVQTTKNWFSSLGLFDVSPDYGGRWHVAVTSFMKRSRFGDQISLDIQDNDIQIYVEPLPGSPSFTPEEWHTIAIEVNASRKACLYQDDALVSCNALLPASRDGIVNVHGGPIYVGEKEGTPFHQGSYVLVDNLKIICWL